MKPIAPLLLLILLLPGCVAYQPLQFQPVKKATAIAPKFTESYYFGDRDHNLYFVMRSSSTDPASGKPIEQIATELSHRLSRIFLKDDRGERPVLRHQPQLQLDPNYKDCIPFYEYFHGDTGAGLGSSHQTGWTGLVTKLMQQSGAPDTRE